MHREGHCRVPQTHKEGDVNLGSWVSVQRTKKDALSLERQRLDEIGFVWETLTATWEAGFNALKQFQEREGHYRVPHTHKEGDVNLTHVVTTHPPVTAV
jgi:hypothetical protein